MADGAGSTQAEDVDLQLELERLQSQNAALRSQLRWRTVLRRWLARVLVVLSSILVVVSTVSVWTYRTALDTDRFVATVEPALEDPVFYSMLGDRITEETLEALDLEARIAGRLTQVDEYLAETLRGAITVDPRAAELLERVDRPSLAALAPPITAALEGRVAQFVDNRVTSEEFQERFRGLVRQGHEAAVALVRNDLAELPNVYTADGEVRLNLIPIIADVVRQLVDEIRELLPDVEVPDVISDRVEDGRQQLSEALQARLPADLGQVTLMSEDNLSGAQDAVDRLDRFMWVILLLTVVMIGATIGVSPNRRRTVVALGIGVTVAVILAVVLLRRLRAAILAEVETPDGQRATGALLTETMSGLRATALLVVVIALVVAVAAYLAGRPAWLRRSFERWSRLVATTPAGSELDRWVARHDDILRVAGIAVAVAIVFVIGIELLPLLLLGAALAVYLWAIAAGTRRATPAATAPESEPDPDDVTTSPS